MVSGGLGGHLGFLTRDLKDCVIFDIVDHIGWWLWNCPESLIKIRLDLGLGSYSLGGVGWFLLGLRICLSKLIKVWLVSSYYYNMDPSLHYQPHAPYRTRQDRIKPYRTKPFYYSWEIGLSRSILNTLILYLREPSLFLSCFLWQLEFQSVAAKLDRIHMDSGLQNFAFYKKEKSLP